MRYLLDRNIVSNLVRDPHGAVAQHIRAKGEAQVCTSIIVAAELRYGAGKKRSPRLSTQDESVLRALDTLPFCSPGDEAYARIRNELEASGTPIGGNDLLIAAQVLSLGYTLVTDNEREFNRIGGLSVENWIRA
jgi:tRNA(fMet)-specific endonuclease VapC